MSDVLLQEILSGIKGIKSDVSGLKNDVSDIKNEISSLKIEVTDMKTEQKLTNDRLSSIENQQDIFYKQTRS